LTAALQDRPVSLRTVQRIALVIARTPAIPEAVELLDEEHG
jgi:ABC-type phosphate transport system ATPase subunit